MMWKALRALLQSIKRLRVPWPEPGSQFTALFERCAIDLLRDCSITGAVRLLRISPSSRVVERHA